MSIPVTTIVHTHSADAEAGSLLFDPQEVAWLLALELNGGGYKRFLHLTGVRSGDVAQMPHRSMLLAARTGIWEARLPDVERQFAALEAEPKVQGISLVVARGVGPAFVDTNRNVWKPDGSQVNDDEWLKSSQSRSFFSRWIVTGRDGTDAGTTHPYFTITAGRTQGG